MWLSQKKKGKKKASGWEKYFLPNKCSYFIERRERKQTFLINKKIYVPKHNMLLLREILLIMKHILYVHKLKTTQSVEEFIITKT